MARGMVASNVQDAEVTARWHNIWLGCAAFFFITTGLFAGLFGGYYSAWSHRPPCDENSRWVYGNGSDFDNACHVVGEDGLYAIPGATCPSDCDAWHYRNHPMKLAALSTSNRRHLNEITVDEGEAVLVVVTFAMIIEKEQPTLTKAQEQYEHQQCCQNLCGSIIDFGNAGIEYYGNQDLTAHQQIEWQTNCTEYCVNPPKDKQPCGNDIIPNSASNPSCTLFWGYGSISSDICTDYKSEFQSAKTYSLRPQPPLSTFCTWGVFEYPYSTYSQFKMLRQACIDNDMSSLKKFTLGFGASVYNDFNETNDLNQKVYGIGKTEGHYSYYSYKVCVYQIARNGDRSICFKGDPMKLFYSKFNNRKTPGITAH